jgi:hypothetical protein
VAAGYLSTCSILSRRFVRHAEEIDQHLSQEAEENDEDGTIEK